MNQQLTIQERISNWRILRTLILDVIFIVYLMNMEGTNYILITRYQIRCTQYIIGIRHNWFPLWEDIKPSLTPI